MNKHDLNELFKTDSEFINNYSMFHPEVESNLEAVVEDNWNKIKDLNIVNTEYGYFAVDNSDVVPWIVGFYVKPEYRKNNTLELDIKEATSGMFLTCVSNTNTRAINFLTKFCKIMNKDNIKTVFYCMRGK